MEMVRRRYIMRSILISVILLSLAFQPISGCGISTPERQAREQYEYDQRFDAEMERLERGGLPDKTERDWKSFIIGFVIGGTAAFILVGILWDADRRKWFEVTR